MQMVHTISTLTSYTENIIRNSNQLVTTEYRIYSTYHGKL